MSECDGSCGPGCPNCDIERAAQADEDYGTCVTCWGEGEVVVCCDDICRARKECIHGDGMGPCPDCAGGCP